MAMRGPLFVVEFDERSDDGPRLCGPFRSRKAADEWASGLRLRYSAYGIVKLWIPPDSGKHEEVA